MPPGGDRMGYEYLGYGGSKIRRGIWVRLVMWVRVELGLFGFVFLVCRGAEYWGKSLGQKRLRLFLRFGNWVCFA